MKEIIILMMWGFILGMIFTVFYLGILAPIIDFIKDRIYDWKFKRNTKILDEYFRLKSQLQSQLINNGLKDYDPGVTIYSYANIDISEVKEYIKYAKRKRLCR